jgi:hypothetical protein
MKLEGFKDESLRRVSALAIFPLIPVWITPSPHQLSSRAVVEEFPRKTDFR